MKFLLLSFAFLSKANAHNVTVYQPSGSVVGDFTNVRSFPPKVLLNYLAECANATISDSDSCLVSTFASLRVYLDLDNTFSCESCVNPPNITGADIEASVLDAQAACTDAGEPASLSDTQALSQKYMTIAASPCWDSLRQDDAHLFVESKWIKSCADVRLPYPVPEEFVNLFTIESVQHRSVVTCMLDNVFDVDPTISGIPPEPIGSPESCLVPGYHNLTSLCATVVGPKAYLKCSTNHTRPSPMSMDYTGNDEVIFIEEFCEILESLNTEIGRSCLMDICDFDPTGSPSALQTSPPTSPPTKPSPPSVIPTLKPSPSPFSTQTLEPTMPITKPTSIPTLQPESPTMKPSPAPSLSPTKAQPIGNSPSLKPVSSPSPKPTPSSIFFPSMSQHPSTTEIQAFISVEVSAIVALNISLKDISTDGRQSIFGVFELAVQSVVEGTSTATVGLAQESIRFRRLLSGASVDLEVKVAASRDCRHNDCDAYGFRVAERIEGNIRESIADGELVKSMHALASTNNVELLQSADIYTFTFLNETVTAENVVAEDPDVETSSAPASAGHLAGVAAIVLLSLFAHV